MECLNNVLDVLNSIYHLTPMTDCVLVTGHK